MKTLLLLLAITAAPSDTINEELLGTYRGDSIWSDILLHPFVDDCNKITLSSISIDDSGRATVTVNDRWIFKAQTTHNCTMMDGPAREEGAVAMHLELNSDCTRPIGLDIPDADGAVIRCWPMHKLDDPANESGTL